MANSAKPAFDAQAHQQALDTLYDKFEYHEFAFQADTFHNLFQAIDADQKLFAEAKQLGMDGVLMYINEIRQAREVAEHAAHERGMVSQKRFSDPTIESLRKQLEETRQKYMKPIDFFKEKLEKHDWYYNFSDDITVYRRGKATEEALLKEAQELGPEFVKEFEASLQRVTDNIRSK